MSIFQNVISIDLTLKVFNIFLSRMSFFESVFKLDSLIRNNNNSNTRTNCEEYYVYEKRTDITIDILIDKMFNESIVNTMNANVIQNNMS